MAFDIGPRIGIEGEAQFRQAITALNTSFRTLGTEMSTVTSQFDRNDRSSRALTAQSGVLNRQIETQRERLVQLNSGLAQSTARYGENHRVTQGWQQAVNRANAELNNMERTLENNARSIAIQNSNWTRLGQTLDSVGSRMRTVGAGMKNLGQTMAMGLTAPIVAAGVASAKLASDLSENMNKVDVAFSKNSGEVKSWSKTTLQSFGISQGSALEMASLFGDMGTAMGQSTSEASKMSTGLVGLAGDLASFKNIGIAQAQDALKGIFTGEGESLKSLGIIMQDSTLKAFALATGQKKSYKEMSQAEKVALRYAFVMDATKNSQGDFARTSEGSANQTRIFGETMKELGANMGQYILPVVTPLITKLSEMAQAFGKLDKGTKKTILVIVGLVAVIGPALIIIGSLISAVGTITVAFGAASTSIAAAGGIIAVLTGPVAIAIAAITGLIAIGVLLYKNWDTISAKARAFGAVAGEVFNGFKNAASGAINAVIGFFQNLHLPEIKIPKIKLPHFSTSGSFSLNPPGIPSFGVNWYDKGAVFNSPTVIGVGEKRPEFVGALDDLRSIVRSEIERASDRSVPQAQPAESSQPIQINLHMDGKVISQQLFRLQKGRLQSLGVQA